jgi:hypothetical protein
LTEQKTEENADQEKTLVSDHQQQINQDIQTLIEHLAEFKKKHPEQFFGTPEWELWVQLDAQGHLK